MGTGLGLSICHGIVTSLGGEITVESEVGKARTSAWSSRPFPALRGPSDGAGRAPAPRFRSRRVLVVDDEPVRRPPRSAALCARARGGARQSGREALALLAPAGRFDAVLCDLNMPEMTGPGLYEALRTASPELAERIIFMTGGTFTQRARDFLAAVERPLLEKPLDLSAVRALLLDAPD